MQITVEDRFGRLRQQHRVIDVEAGVEFRQVTMRQQLKQTLAADRVHWKIPLDAHHAPRSAAQGWVVGAAQERDARPPGDGLLVAALVAPNHAGQDSDFFVPAKHPPNVESQLYAPRPISTSPLAPTTGN